MADCSHKETVNFVYQDKGIHTVDIVCKDCGRTVSTIDLNGIEILDDIKELEYAIGTDRE